MARMAGAGGVIAAGAFLLCLLLFSDASAAESTALKARKEQILKQKKAEATKATQQQNSLEQQKTKLERTTSVKQRVPAIIPKKSSINNQAQTEQKTLDLESEPTETAPDQTINPVKFNQLAAERIAKCQTQPDAGPEMILIAAGKFLQGSDNNEPGHQNDESPRHEVTIPEPFAISRCEVTVAEFRLFIEDTGYKTEAERSSGCYYFDTESNEVKQQPDYFWDNPGFEQDGNHPVACVSWNDAKAYIKWLNDDLKLPENTYRLPTESEWEYAARAGTQSAFFWGEQSQCDYANGADTSLQNTNKYPESLDYAECDDGFVYTAPVGSFKANQWGLYDLAGNVWEWVADCWHDSYQDSPQDGSAWLDEGNDSCMRSVRGGGWSSLPAILRSANRYWIRADVALNYLGFRLARTL